MTLMKVMLEKVMKERKKQKKLKDANQFLNTSKTLKFGPFKLLKVNLNYLALYVCIGSKRNYGELRLSFQMN